MVRRKLITQIGVGLALNLLLTLAEAAGSVQQTVVPGRSIGTITLGMPRLDVWKHIGKPTEIHRLHVAGRLYAWDTWREENNRERATVISRRGRVVQVEREVTEGKASSLFAYNIRT